MCGIAGILADGRFPTENLREAVERMSICLAHRGPDDAGTFVDCDARVGLGFRRLSIIDLSPAGHQPMQSASGRFTVIFNGEVYNYIEIRRELEEAGTPFRGHSDTEVILGAFERWGILSAVKRFVGMFAIAVWDAQEKKLTLVRDRLGIKPLYYFHGGGIVSFGSELKALVAGPLFDRTIDEDALNAYLRYLYIPAPLTIYKHVRKLPPGHILTLRTAAAPPEPEPYWSLDEAYAAGVRNPFVASDEEVVGELRSLLSDAVRLRMRSDVPMGALLSGGIDSSTIVALMQSHATRPARTFSIGFPGTPHDEAKDAARIASVLGTDHTEMTVTADDALGVIPLIPDLFDEPFADPSQIPTYLVSKLARREVTVALTGDGGDELFAGYERYVSGEPLIRRLQSVPRLVRQMVGVGLRSSSARFWDRAYRVAAPLTARSHRHRLAGEKIRKFGNLLRASGDNAMYRSLLSAWQDPDQAITSGAHRPSRVEELLEQHRSLPLLDRMMLIDQQTYLAEDMLAKVDRASMAVGLEARVPLLDHRVVEFSWRLDRRFRIRDGRGKWALRQVLYGFVDPQLVDRPKTGFSVPVAAWLRGPLRGWAEDLLFGAPDKDRVLSPNALRDVWGRFQTGADELALAVWAALMFEAWKQRWAPS